MDWKLLTRIHERDSRHYHGTSHWLQSSTMGSSWHCRMPVSNRAIIASKGIIGVASKSGNMAYLSLSIVSPPHREGKGRTELERREEGWECSVRLSELSAERAHLPMYLKGSYTIFSPLGKYMWIDMYILSIHTYTLIYAYVNIHIWYMSQYV